MKPEDLPAFVIDHIQPCEHRHTFEGTHNAICMLASKCIGFRHAVNAFVCAKCKLDGEVNKEFIGQISFDALMAHCNYIYLGFHEQNTEEVKVEIFKRACTLAQNDKEQLKRVSDHLHNAVRKGRISYDAAVKLAQEHMKPLLEETK